MRQLVVAALSLAVALGARAAEFEGRAEYRMTGAEGPAREGHAVVYLSPKGSRSELDVAPPPELAKQGMKDRLRMVSIVKASEPGRVYFVNEAAKSYSVIESKDAGEPGRWTVERAGSDRVAGLRCDRAKIQGPEGARFDACVTRELGTVAAWAAAAGDTDSALPRALAKAGLDGLPARWVVLDAKTGEPQMTMELVSARKQKVPAAMLEVPGGYSRSEVPAPAVSPETQKQMEEALRQRDEALKNLPPEQRQRLEELMKGGGGEPPAGK
jgi:Domain of unknown function (DUF4412)